MNATDLLKSWLEYAKSHRIQTPNQPGSPATAYDVADFLKSKGFDDSDVFTVLDNFVDAEVMPEKPGLSPEYKAPEKSIDSSPKPANSQPAQKSRNPFSFTNKDMGEPALTKDQEEDLAIIYSIIKKLDSAQKYQLKRELKYV